MVTHDKCVVKHLVRKLRKHDLLMRYVMVSSAAGLMWSWREGMWWQAFLTSVSRLPWGNRTTWNMPNGLLVGSTYCPND